MCGDNSELTHEREKFLQRDEANDRRAFKLAEKSNEAMNKLSQAVEMNTKAIEENRKAVAEMVNLLRTKVIQKPIPIVDERISATMKTEKLEVDMRSKLFWNAWIILFYLFITLTLWQFEKLWKYIPRWFQLLMDQASSVSFSLTFFFSIMSTNFSNSLIAFSSSVSNKKSR